MALTTTTNSVAIGVADTQITVASATGFGLDYLIRVDGEFMRQRAVASGLNIPVVRGVNGTATVAHAVTSNVTVGLPSDFADAPIGVADAVTNPAQPAWPIYSYGAAGAIALKAGIHVINGAVALAMTLADPTQDQDGTMIVIASNGKAAHTVTYTAGLGDAGAGYDVCTFTTGAQQSLFLMALNASWQQVSSPMSGTLTALQIAIA